mgnify:CR=1 FL=1
MGPPGTRPRLRACSGALRTLTPEILADALRELTTNKAMADNARSVGAMLAEENGLETAVNFIEATIDAAKAGARRFPASM